MHSNNLRLLHLYILGQLKENRSKRSINIEWVNQGIRILILTFPLYDDIVVRVFSQMIRDTEPLWTNHYEHLFELVLCFQFL